MVSATVWIASGTLDGRHYTLMQQGNFLLWAFSGGAELDENRFVLSVVNCLVRLLQLRAILHLDLGYETEVLATQSHIWFPKRNQQHQAEVQQKPLKTFLI